ncbi:MAG TPA: alpha/beta hydrolase [Nitrososphaera sp.]
MPVLVLCGDIYPASGGDFPGNFALSSTQALATSVTGVTVPLSAHWIPEEQPEFVIDQLFNFFGNTTNGANLERSLAPLILLRYEEIPFSLYFPCDIINQLRKAQRDSEGDYIHHISILISNKILDT